MKANLLSVSIHIINKYTTIETCTSRFIILLDDSDIFILYIPDIALVNNFKHASKQNQKRHISAVRRTATKDGVIRDTTGYILVMYHII